MSYVWGENTNITNAKKCLWWCVYKHNWEHYAQQLYSISKCWVCACCTSYTPQPSYCTILRWRLHFAVGKKKALWASVRALCPWPKTTSFNCYGCVCWAGLPISTYRCTCYTYLNVVTFCIIIDPLQKSISPVHRWQHCAPPPWWRKSLLSPRSLFVR